MRAHCGQALAGLVLAAAAAAAEELVNEGRQAKAQRWQVARRGRLQQLLPQRLRHLAPGGAAAGRQGLQLLRVGVGLAGKGQGRRLQAAQQARRQVLRGGRGVAAQQ